MTYLTFMDETGDSSLTWDEDTAEKMIPIIERRMAEGFKFFILEDQPGDVPARKIELKDPEQLKGVSSVIVKDEDLMSLLTAGTVSLAPPLPATRPVNTARRARTPKEVVSSKAPIVGVKAARGG